MKKDKRKKKNLSRCYGNQTIETWRPQLYSEVYFFIDMDYIYLYIYVIREMQRLKLDLLWISEMRWPGFDICQVNRYHIY